MAKKAIETIITCEQQPKDEGMGKFSGKLLWKSSDNIINMPGDKEAIKQFNRDLYKTIPGYYDPGYHFIWAY